MGVKDLWKPLEKGKTTASLYNGDLQGWTVAVDVSVLMHGVVGQGGNAVTQVINKVAASSECLLAQITDIFEKLYHRGVTPLPSSMAQQDPTKQQKWQRERPVVKL
uniref:Uncharacterized protein n=1 Tax=Chrysotila carterae TaxID=13221 RepID=A0A7S4ESH0_CHRCT